MSTTPWLRATVGSYQAASNKREEMKGVAVIIPAHNAGATLRVTIDSALLQEGTAEIVIIDDGSCDDTLAIARSFEPRVTVLTGPNQGVSTARNRGIAATRATWLLFLDADDILEPNSILQRLLVVEATRADVVICDWRDLVDDGRGKVALGERRTVDWARLVEDPEIAIATSVWATTAAILYGRDLVQRIGGFRGDLPIIQDARFLFDAAFQGARFAHAPHVGALYRVSTTSLSRRNPASFWLDVLLNGKQIEDLWRGRGPLAHTQTHALAQVYDNAARGLFDAAHTAYFDAVRRQRSLDHPMSLHGRIAAPLARLAGLRYARSIVAATSPVAFRLRQMRSS